MTQSSESMSSDQQRIIHLKENELTEQTNLCNLKGELIEDSIGWSRKPVHNCNLIGHWPRKKKWNYWCITSDKYLFSVTLSNIDYLGIAFVYFFERDAKKFIEQTAIVPLGKGCVLPETVNGNVVFNNNSIKLSFKHEQNSVRIQVESSNFGGEVLTADLFVEYQEDHETLNVVIPWSKKRFQFTSKHNCLETEGTVLIGKKIYLFEKSKSYACLDFGRGIWKYSGFWNWASCSGNQEGHTIGINLGGGWTDGTGMTENSVLVDNRINKISEDIIFTYDASDFMKEWKIKTKETNQIDIRFKPIYERIAKTNALILKSEVHQLFGCFSGTILTNEGDIFEIKNIFGWAEEHKAKW